jgi:hypothetical protein
LIHQRRINPVPRSEERRQCHRLRRACRPCAHIPCDGEPEGTATGAAPSVASLALRLDSPAGPGNQGWVRRNNNSGATGNSVDRLPPTLARVAGGEVAYAASQVLCARADRSCASLASATTWRSCECHGTLFPVQDRCHSISEKPPQGGVSRSGARDAGSLAGTSPKAGK